MTDFGCSGGVGCYCTSVLETGLSYYLTNMKADNSLQQQLTASSAQVWLRPIIHLITHQTLDQIPSLHPTVYPPMYLITPLISPSTSTSFCAINIIGTGCGHLLRTKKGASSTLLSAHHISNGRSICVVFGGSGRGVHYLLGRTGV